MIIKAPYKFLGAPRPTVFLAGSIEMGTAVDWQKDVGKTLSEAGATVLSPRRDDFDPSQRQSIDNDYFRGQVEWELQGLEYCDFSLMYLAPDPKSPISLLELGLFGPKGRMIVCCPDEFWRQGNVEIVCARYGIMLRKSLEDAVDEILLKIARWI